MFADLSLAVSSEFGVGVAAAAEGGAKVAAPAELVVEEELYEGATRFSRHPGCNSPEPGVIISALLHSIGHSHSSAQR